MEDNIKDTELSEDQVWDILKFADGLMGNSMYQNEFQFSNLGFQSIFRIPISIADRPIWRLE